MTRRILTAAAIALIIPATASAEPPVTYAHSRAPLSCSFYEDRAVCGSRQMSLRIIVTPTGSVYTEGLPGMYRPGPVSVTLRPGQGAVAGAWIIRANRGRVAADGRPASPGSITVISRARRGYGVVFFARGLAIVPPKGVR